MKKTIIYTALAILAGTCFAGRASAKADPAVNGAAVNPSPITSATGISVSFSTTNNGTATSSTTVTLVVSLSQLAPSATFNIATDITGTGAALFTWTYDAPTNTFTGTLHQNWPQFSGGPVVVGNLISTGLSSPGAEANGLNVNVGAPGAVNSSTTNDNTNAYTSSSVVLPVTLVSFGAEASGCTVEVRWKTAEETGISGYAVQQSTDGITFYTLSKEPATGGGDYSYEDKNALGGVSYYRLSVQEGDGYSYSPAVRVSVDCGSTARQVRAWPNPSSGVVHITGIAAGETVGAYNALGQEVQELKTVGTMVDVDLSGLPSGNYVLEVRGAGGIVVGTLKVVKQ